MNEGAYTILRTKQGVTAVDGCGDHVPLRLDLFNHSPTGFEFGYAGSGPAQLALAILADYTEDDELAMQLHQKFKSDLISNQRNDGFIIHYDTICQWLRRHGEINDTK